MSTRVSPRRLLSVTAVSAFCVAMMLGAASSAQATTSMSCVFDGGMNWMTPGPEGIVSDVLPIGSNPLDTDSGTYNFEAPWHEAACAGATTQGGAFADFAQIHSSGSYTNFVCDTLTEFFGNPADTTVTSQDQLPGSEPNVTSADLDIEVVAGQGPLTVHSATLSNGDMVDGPSANDLAGWVALEPADPGPVPGDPLRPATACTLDRAIGFYVQGFFTLAPPDL